jgi:hypothetical protein
MPEETREEMLRRWEAEGLCDPTCSGCAIYYETPDKRPSQIMHPHHVPSKSCESGKHPHCTCDTCW